MQVQVSQPEMIQELVSHASKARSTGSTGVNDESSRSHSIMQFALKRETDSDGHPVGKISFIDLAGSERGADTYDNNRCISKHTLLFPIITSNGFARLLLPSTRETSSWGCHLLHSIDHCSLSGPG